MDIGQKYFLLQVGGYPYGYPSIVNDRRYQNEHWAGNRKNIAQGDVEPGDMLLVYCTSTVRNCPSSIAFQVRVKGVSADKTVLCLEEPDWFARPLIHGRIHELVAQGVLADSFRSCGQQGFNIRPLTVQEARGALKMLRA